MTRDTLADAEYFTAKIAEEETSIAGIRERIPEMIEKRGGRVLRSERKVFPNMHRDDPRAEPWRQQYMNNGGSE